VANELDKNLREWADNAMRPKEPVEPEHHEGCVPLYSCHPQCEVLWTETMKRVGASLTAVVDMVNEGDANPEDVVREGRDD
jgi:hypothetical protein